MGNYFDQPLDRRVLIAGAAGAAVAGGTTIAQAQQPAAPREKGPKVWMEMDQKDLDDAYDQAMQDQPADVAGPAPEGAPAPEPGPEPAPAPEPAPEPAPAG